MKYYPRMSDYDRTTMHTWLVSGFTYLEDIIEFLEETVANFADMFYEDYKSARPIYETEEEFVYCFRKVLIHNAKKYEIWMQVYSAEYDPIENYNRTETGNNTRTPNLTTQVYANSQRKQTQTTTETPNTYKETVDHKVAPYDSGTKTSVEENETTYSGSRSTSVSYTGDPDTMNSTTTNSGNEQTYFSSHVSGNIGVTTSQMMLQSSLDLAARMKLAEEIEKDVAKELLLQVWL